MKKLISLLLVLVMATSLFVGCGDKEKEKAAADVDGVSETSEDKKQEDAKDDEGEAIVDEPYKLSFMLTTHTGEPMSEDSPVQKAIEAYTNTDLELLWVPNATYDDKMNITFASGELPTLMLLPKKTSSVINAARNGAFWDLGPYLKDYPNLSQANEQVLNNISIDGGVYGIYRARDLGRNGITFRSDWLENVGLETPKTIDDVYEVLKAFKNDDPDQNGQDDTYGMTVTKWVGPWNVMQTWFGAPNKWGEDSTGKLVPDFMTDEYVEALKFFNKLYEEGLVNEDFAMMESSKWTEPYLAGKAGMVIDVADFSTSLQGKFENELGYEKDNIVWDVVGSVEGPNGTYNLPFAGGYNGMIAITKDGAETEEDLRKALDFLDKMNDLDMQITMMYGLEGTGWDYVDGIIVKNPDAVKTDFNDAAQMGTNVVGDFRKNPDVPLERSPLVIKRNQVMVDNIDIVVANPCEPFVSDTYAKKGAQLDKIIEDARIQFIVGVIDEEALKDAVDLWRTSGGDDIISEYNALYEQFGN